MSLLSAVVLGLSGCVVGEVPSDGDRSLALSRSAVAPDSVPTDLIRLTDRIAATEAVWPGFDLGDHVLIAAFLPNGPVYLIGDSTPPADYRWLDPQRLIAVRDGIPPDSLSTARVGMRWHGREFAATAFPFAEESTSRHLPAVLIHEAFHTHQQRVRARAAERFVARGNACFPDTSLDAVALLNLEGHYLGAALQAETHPEARELGRRAVAVRQHRCSTRGAAECARERAIEQVEGTATYVETVLLGEAVRYGTAEVWVDSLARSLARARGDTHLHRGRFYDTGHAWLLLLERLDPENWKHRVEWLALDQVVAEEVGVDYEATASQVLESAIRGEAWEAALRSARRSVLVRVWGGETAPGGACTGESALQSIQLWRQGAP